MPGKRALVIDAYHVIKVFRELGVSFDEIARLGCRIDGESDLNVTPEVLAAWYEAEKEERDAGTPEGSGARSKNG